MSIKALSIFDRQVARKPDFYPQAKEFMKAIQDSHWTHRLFTFTSDVQDFFVSFDDTRRSIITRSLSAISQVELPVKSFWAYSGQNLPHPSIIDMGYTFAANEVIHSEAYSQLLERLGLYEKFEEILKEPIISGRINYLTRYVQKFSDDERKQFLYSIILFTIFIENLSLFSQFYIINWFGKFENVLKDTVSQVTYTAREEEIHFRGGVYLINQIIKEFPELFDDELKNRVFEECDLTVKYESNIVEWILDGFKSEGLDEGELCSLSKDSLVEFIKDRLNKALVLIGLPPRYEVNKDLLSQTEWFKRMTLGGLQNDFFNSKPTEYAKSNQSFSEDELFND